MLFLLFDLIWISGFICFWDILEVLIIVFWFEIWFHHLFNVHLLEILVLFVVWPPWFTIRRYQLYSFFLVHLQIGFKQPIVIRYFSSVLFFPDFGSWNPQNQMGIVDSALQLYGLLLKGFNFSFFFSCSSFNSFHFNELFNLLCSFL